MQIQRIHRRLGQIVVVVSKYCNLKLIQYTQYPGDVWTYATGFDIKVSSYVSSLVNQ